MRFSRRLAEIPTVIMLDTDARIQALGTVSVVEVGAEFVYVERDGARYCFRPADTSAFMKGLLDCSRLRIYRDNSICPAQPQTECRLRLVKACRCPACQC